jgi:TIR domain
MSFQNDQDTKSKSVFIRSSLNEIKNIFISHITEEEELAASVKKLIESIDATKLKCYLSSDKTLWKIEKWLDRIKKELQAADIIVLMLSPLSVARPWINIEWGAAWMLGRADILPALYCGLTAGDLPKPFGDDRAIDIEKNPETFYSMVSESVLGHPSISHPPGNPLYENLRKAIGINSLQIPDKNPTSPAARKAARILGAGKKPRS